MIDVGESFQARGLAAGQPGELSLVGGADEDDDDGPTDNAAGPNDDVRSPLASA